LNAATRFSAILEGRRSISAYPEHKVRRVAQITTEVTGAIERIDAVKTGFAMADFGAWGPVIEREEERSELKYPLSYAQKGEVGAIFSPIRDGDVYPELAPIPDDPRILSNHIKSLGYFLKADAVGICELPQWAVYARDVERDPIVCDHKYAIVIISQWGYETTKASTGDDWISDSESWLSYNESAHIACTMASYIRRLGYPARGHLQTGNEHVPGYDVILTPLLVLAGLGELSRPGWALHPYLGGRFKASVVTTDLPLLPDKPIDFGLQAFCRTCKRCARHCPSRSISDADHKIDDYGYGGYRSYEFDWERCTKYRLMNQNGAYCGVCVKVCPWNKPKAWWHDIVRRSVRSAPRLDPLWVKLDEWLGYGKAHPELKWWFDLEEVDGHMRIPPRSPDNAFWQTEGTPTDEWKKLRADTTTEPRMRS
jgi:3-chloro-4-hydroxyphenylacetate reductive dehalogenase